MNFMLKRYTIVKLNIWLNARKKGATVRRSNTNRNCTPLKTRVKGIAKLTLQDPLEAVLTDGDIFKTIFLFLKYVVL